jgi:hypothetical protein
VKQAVQAVQRTANPLARADEVPRVVSAVQRSRCIRRQIQQDGQKVAVYSVQPDLRHQLCVECLCKAADTVHTEQALFEDVPPTHTRGIDNLGKSVFAWCTACLGCLTQL